MKDADDEYSLCLEPPGFDYRTLFERGDPFLEMRPVLFSGGASWPDAETCESISERLTAGWPVYLCFDNPEDCRQCHHLLLGKGVLDASDPEDPFPPPTPP
jgi:hypothetical protein